ncbi:MAG TPA: immunity 53 family protein [Acidobacteriaceae bacterium]|jgi:hypothetical protein|nr:immunity 53 family protein [Acidobacteriaceae bacterium]
MEGIIRLQKWYADQCDGDWEHQYGVKIDTLDNPGWTITIDPGGTPQAELAFERVSLNCSDADWMLCWIENSKFEGRGDPQKLDAMIQQFLIFAGL